MILTDTAIREMMRQGDLIIEPLEEMQIQPASVDLRIGNSFLKIDENNASHITLDTPPLYTEIKQDTIILPPHSFILATTKEYISIPANVIAFVEGRSSIGRIGLFIQNAGWVDPGFQGEITLELYNANRIPIELQSGRRICQLVLSKLPSTPSKIYQGKYQRQKGATGSKIFKDTEVV